MSNRCILSDSLREDRAKQANQFDFADLLVLFLSLINNIKFNSTFNSKKKKKKTKKVGTVQTENENNSIVDNYVTYF